MSEASLDWRLGILERRLSRVEQHLGLAGEEAPQAVEVLPVVAEPVVELPFTEPPALTDHLLHLRAAKQPAEAAEQPPFVAESIAPHLPPPLPTSRVAFPYARVAVKAPPAAATGLEQAIGLKWAGWIGAIILVIGTGLGIKFAYDQGWFSAVPDSAKLLLMSLGGFALIGAGEWVYRRVNRLSAAGLFGAGIAVFFLVSYAGFGFYALYARNTAFVLMALSTIAGACVARRGNLVSIAVLSLLGGNLAPILLRGPTPALPAFFAYLLMLQAVALTLAGWGGETKWWTLRGLSLTSNTLWMLALLLDTHSANARSTETFFLITSAALYQIELILSAWRGNQPSSYELASPGVIFSTLVTAALAGGLLMVWPYASDSARGSMILALAAACAALGFLLPERDRPGIRVLRRGYRVQAAILLVVAVPVMLSGVSIDIGWIALAIAFSLFAWFLDLSIARRAAVITWGLAVGHFFLRVGLDASTGARSIWLHGIPRDLIVAAVLALSGHGIAMLVERCRSGSRRADALHWIPTLGASVVWIVACIALLSPVGATFALVAYAWVLVSLDLFTDRLHAAIQSAVVLLLATVKWVLIDLVADRLSTNWSPAARPGVINSAMCAGLLIAISLVWLFVLRREALLAALRRWGIESTSARAANLCLAALVIFLMSIGISFEIDRVVERHILLGGVFTWPPSQVKQFALTMLWSAAATGQLLLARYVLLLPQERRVWLGRIGWLPMLLAVKFLILDTLIYRAMSGPAPVGVFFNLQTLTAMITLAALIAVCFIATECHAILPRRIAGFLIVLLLLWTGLLEIDRAFENLAARGAMSRAHALFAKQVAVSIFGAVFAILSVAAGFRFRSAPVRYLGLGLFGVTLLKVVFIDLADAGQGYRVLSFLGLGLLLLGTSVLYGKLSPRLLKE